jgi:O-antigen ligase
MSVRQPLAIFFCMTMAVSLIWSKALFSISMVLFAMLSAVDLQIQPLKIKWILTPAIVRATIRFKPFIWVYALFTCLYLLSIVYAGNLKEWWTLTNMSMAFLLIAMSFAMVKPFTRSHYMMVTLCMVVMAFWSSLRVLFLFYQNHDHFTQSLGMGGSLPTPTDHIRYSMIVACSMMLCLFFALEDWKLKYRWERIGYGFLAVYFFIFLHILSVRSGLAVMYLGLILLGIFYLKRIALWKKLILAVFLLGAPVVAYQVLPGFKQKINYTLWDFKQFMAGNGSTYSDSQRWETLQAGLAIGKKHPLFGAGTGKFRQEMAEYFKEVFHKDIWYRPHNQFINVFAIFGLFGLAVFLFMLIYPMTFRPFWSIPLIPTLYFMQLLSMMVEHPLDTEVGAGLFLLLTIMGLSMLDDESFGALP